MVLELFLIKIQPNNFNYFLCVCVDYCHKPLAAPMADARDRHDVGMATGFHDCGARDVSMVATPSKIFLHQGQSQICHLHHCHDVWSNQCSHLIRPDPHHQNNRVGIAD